MLDASGPQKFVDILYGKCHQKSSRIRSLLKGSKRQRPLPADSCYQTLHAAGDWPLLCLAVERENLEIARMLIEDFGAHVDVAETGQWQTPLHLAVNAEQSSYELTKLLLDNGASQRVVDISGDSPLGCAIRNKDYGLVDLLLTRGGMGLANEPCARNGITPLYMAVYLGCPVELIQLLVDHGADPTRTVERCSPLYVAVNRHADSYVIRFLADQYIRRGLSINAATPPYSPSVLELAIQDNDMDRIAALAWFTQPAEIASAIEYAQSLFRLDAKTHLQLVQGRMFRGEANALLGGHSRLFASRDYAVRAAEGAAVPDFLPSLPQGRPIAR